MVPHGTTDGGWPMVEDARRESVAGDYSQARMPQRRPMAPVSDAVPRPAAPQRRVAAVPVAASTCRCGGHVADPGAGWWRKIPGRLWMALMVLTSPVRALVIVLDGLVAGAVVCILAVAWAWWTHRISDDQVAQVLGQIGARGLSILSKAGIM